MKKRSFHVHTVIVNRYKKNVEYMIECSRAISVYTVTIKQIWKTNTGINYRNIILLSMKLISIEYERILILVCASEIH